MQLIFFLVVTFFFLSTFQLCIQLINNNKDCSIYVNYTTRKSFQQIKNKLTIIIPVLIYNIHWYIYILKSILTVYRYIFLGVLLIYLGPSYAVDIPPPPYQLGNGQFIFIGVEWDEQTIKDFLPKKLKPVAKMTGGINIYYTKLG